MKKLQSKTLRALQTGFLTSALLAAPAFGARLAYEGFEYTEANGTVLSSLATPAGSGWDGNYGSSLTGTTTSVNLQNGLTYPGFTSAPSSKAMRFGSGNTLYRPWAGTYATPNTVANGTYWYSFLYRPTAGSRGGTLCAFGKPGDPQNGFGMRMDRGSDITPVALPATTIRFQAWGDNGGGGTLDIADGYDKTYFVLGKTVFNAAGTSTNTLWIYQDPTALPTVEPTTGGISNTINAGGTASFRTALTGRCFSTSGIVIDYDEFRIATSFSQVFPPQPGVAEFELDPLAAVENQTLTFSWSNLPPASNPTLNGSPVTIDGSGAGTATLPAPAVNTTYTLAWTGAGSPLTQDFTAIAPSFTLSPAAGYLGDTVTLNWRIPVGSTGVTLNPGAVDLTSSTIATTGAGSTSIAAPASTTNYTLSYTFGGNPFVLGQTFTLQAPFLSVTPEQAISDQTPLALTWRIPPTWDENTTAANTVLLRYGSPQSFMNQTYSEFDLTANTDPATGAGSHPKSTLFDSPVYPAAGDTEYRLVYNIAETPNTVTDTITLQPLVIQIDDVQNPTNPVTINNSPLADGVLAYLDRGHVWAQVPSILQGAQFVKLSNADKTTKLDPFTEEPLPFSITFTALENATFFLFLDNRIGDGNAGNPPTLGNGVMNWVLNSGFVDTGLDIGLDENPVAGVTDVNSYYSVFFLQVNANEQFTFEAQNDGDGRNMYGIAAVAPQVVPVAFSASPTTINEGGSSALQWTVPVGATASINQGVGAVTVDGVGVGSVSVSPTTTTTYTLTYVVGANPPVSLAPVTVTVIPTPVTIEPFTITSISVAANGDVTFSWPAPAGMTDPLLLADVIERSTTLELASWSVLPTTGAIITNGVVTFTDTDPPTGGKAFYRIKRSN